MSTTLNLAPIAGMTLVAFDGGGRGPCVQIDCWATLTQLDRDEVQALAAVLKRWLDDVADRGGSR